MRGGVVLLAGLAAVAGATLLASAGRSDAGGDPGGGGGGDTPARQRPKQGPPPEQLVVGQPGDPDVAPLLAELEQYLRANAPAGGWSAVELTRMPKAPAQPLAIPPRQLWANMPPTLKLLVDLKQRMGGAPLYLRAYRPPDYDKAVAGSGTSLHTYFAAIDIRADDRARLALEGARLVNARPSESIGFGVYGADPGGRPSNIHLDTGWRRRTWEHARAWLDYARTQGANA
jgi:hypothetical protein